MNSGKVSLVGRSVLITGASRGLGYELVKCFHAAHYQVFPLVRSEEAARALMAEFDNGCYPIVADVRSDDSKECIRSTIRRFTDKIDIVINNAGIPGRSRELEKVEPAEVSELLNVHCLGVLRVVQAAMAFLQNGDNPRIINVSSRLGSLSKMASAEFRDRTFTYSYRVAKAAQNMLTVCMDQELSAKGICVRAIHPGVLLSGPSSLDGDLEVHEAADHIFRWVERLEIDHSGLFVQPGAGELPW